MFIFYLELMNQCSCLASGSDFPLGTPWDWTDPNLSFENPGTLHSLKPTDLGGLRRPGELGQWVGIQNPVTSFTDQRIDDILLGNGKGAGNTHSNGRPIILH